MGRPKIKNKRKEKICFPLSITREFSERINAIHERTGLSKSAVVLRMLHLKGSGK